MNLDPEELEAWILLQLGAFSALCRANDVDFEHVRPHGALYTQCMEERRHCADGCQSRAPIRSLDDSGFAGKSPCRESSGGGQNPDFTGSVSWKTGFLASGMLIMDRFNESFHPQAVIEQVKQLMKDSSITTEDGKVVKVNCKTMHLSPKLQGNMMIGERINAMLGQPVPMAMAAAGSSGWL